MPTLESLTEADLRGLLTAKSLRRAREYVGRVHDLERRGATLVAKVTGSRAYEIEVEVGPDGIIAACSCPYDWGGYCKHIGAVLLRWIQSPHDFATLEAVQGSSAAVGLVLQAVEPPPTYRPENLPGWVTQPFAEHQRAYVAQLERHLDAVKLNDLREMGRHRGWPLRGTRKAALVQQVAGYIGDAEDIRRAIEGLDDEHRQVLRALFLVSSQPVSWPAELERVARAWGPLRAHKQISTYARHLWQEGVALPGYVQESYLEIDAVIPWQLARHFPPLLEELAADEPGVTAASGLRLADPYALVRSTSQVAMMLEQSPVRLREPMPRPHLETFHPELRGWDYVPEEVAEARRQGKLTRRSDLVLTVPPPRRSLPDEAIERLAPLAGGESRLEFIYSLLVAAGILQPGSPTTVWPEVKTHFLRRDELGQRTLLARTYFQMENWSALWEVLRTSGEVQLKRAWFYGSRGPEQLRSELARFRNLLLPVLATLPDGRWVPLGDLLGVLQILLPAFEQSALETYHYLYSGRLATERGAWFLARNGQPLRPGDTGDWDASLGAFVRYILRGPLHWLGLADLWVDGEQLIAFRLHGLADLYWDRVEVAPAPRHAAGQAPEPAAVDAVTIDALSITVDPAVASARAHTLLDRIARLDVAEADRFVYRLDAQAAYESFEGGMALSEILAGWEEHLSIPMPDAIRAQLQAWWQAYGRVRIYQDLTVVEFGDEYALAEMKAVTSLAAYVVAEISPRLVIIRREALGPLVAELERAGYTPKRAEGA